MTRDIVPFAFVPVVIGYFGVLIYMQWSGTHADLKRLVTTLAVVIRPPTSLTRGFSLLWLAVATVGGCGIAMGSRYPSIARVERRYAIAARILCTPSRPETSPIS